MLEFIIALLAAIGTATVVLALYRLWSDRDHIWYAIRDRLWPTNKLTGHTAATEALSSMAVAYDPTLTGTTTSTTMTNVSYVAFDEFNDTPLSEEPPPLEATSYAPDDSEFNLGEALYGTAPDDWPTEEEVAYEAAQGTPLTVEARAVPPPASDAGA